MFRFGQNVLEMFSLSSGMDDRTLSYPDLEPIRAYFPNKDKNRNNNTTSSINRDRENQDYRYVSRGNSR